VLSSPENQTTQVALSSLRAGYVQDHSLALTGTLLGTIPLVVVFGLLGKQIISGIMQGALKG
jgi:cellobiose transport system permease protein